MEQYIKKSALVAEIEKLQLCTMDEHMNYYSAEAQGEYNALSKLESFLDTLEVKDGFTPLDSDFERDAVNFCIDKGLNTTPYIAKTIAKHFFELGMQVSNKAQKGEEV